MAGQTPKPNPLAAWGLTTAAALDLFVLVLLANGNTSFLRLTSFGLCEVVLILCAAGAWKAYFEKFVSHKISENSDAEQGGGEQAATRSEST